MFLGNSRLMEVFMKQVTNRFFTVCFAASLMCSAMVAKADDVTGVITGDDGTAGEVSDVTPGISDGSGQFCDADRAAGFTDCHPSQCQMYNYNYVQCVQAGCQFDGRSGACFGGGYPQPYPGPNPHPYPGPGPYPRPYPGPPTGRGMVCVAIDAGFEEHGGGHQGYGRTQYEAANAAMGDCLRFHGRCRVTQCRPM